MPIKYRLLKQEVKLGKDAGKTLHFARSLITKKVTFERFCEEVSDGSTVDAADTQAVLTRMIKILRRHMEDGDTVDIDGLGLFSPIFGSEGVEDVDKFDVRLHIRKPRVVFRAKPSFSDLSQVSFERITAEEAAVRDAITAKKKGATPSSPGSTPSGGSGSGSSGSGSGFDGH